MTVIVVLCCLHCAKSSMPEVAFVFPVALCRELMAKQKGYDRQDAVARALDAFREIGFQTLGIRNNDIRELTDAYFTELLKATTGLVELAKVNGTVRSNVDSKDAAEFVKGVFMAAVIINRDAGDVTASKGLINMALYTIEAWRT